jgi:hypothetical protein
MIPDQHGNMTKPDDDAEVSILLASEKEWRPFRPSPEDFEWMDIGLAAARIPRFNGQLSPKFACKTWDNYVLAQHLSLCSDLVALVNPNLPIDTQIAIHIHDAEEPVAGLGDPSAPVKHSPFFWASFNAYFRPILDAIADKARISRELMHRDPVVKQFDKLAYRIENATLRGIGRESCPAIPKRHLTLTGQFAVWSTLVAYENWMEKLNHLLALKAEREVSNG